MLSKSAENGFCAASKSVFGDEHTFALANQIFIFEHGEWDVCEGGHWLDVMNQWEVLKMKIRPPAGSKPPPDGVDERYGDFTPTDSLDRPATELDTLGGLEIREGPVAGESLNVPLERVDSEESFLAFIAALAKDRRDAVVAEKNNPSSAYGPDAGGWENTSIEDFLEAATAWAKDTNFGFAQGLVPDNPWKRFALFLYSGKFYE